jgi:hypothetical protein
MYAVKGLENRDRNPWVDVELRLIKIEPKINAGGQVVGRLRELPTEGDESGLALADGDVFMIELRNTGKLDAYINIIELMPDGSVGPVWPRPGYPPEEIVADGKWHRIEGEYFQMGPPHGLNVYKVIATRQPTDFVYLFTEQTRNRGMKGRGADTPLGRLLTDFTSGTRGTKSVSVAPQEWGLQRLRSTSSRSPKCVNHSKPR